MDEIDKLIAARARKIFESEAGPKDVWAQSTDYGEQFFSFQDRGSASDPTMTVVGDKVRQQFIDRARQELKNEGLI